MYVLVSIKRLTIPWGRLHTKQQRTSLLVVDSYANTESDKTKRITRLLLSSGENKLLDLTVMGSINTPITNKSFVFVFVHYVNPVRCDRGFTVVRIR